MYARLAQGGGDDRRNDDKKQTEESGGDDQWNDDKQETDEENLKKMYLAQGARPKTFEKENKPQETGTTSEQPKSSQKSPGQARNDSPIEPSKKPKQTPPEKPSRARTSGSKPPHSGEGKDEASDSPTGASGDNEGTVPSAGKPSPHTESTVVIEKWPFADSPPADASAQEDSQNDGLKKPVTKPPAHTSAKASSAGKPSPHTESTVVIEKWPFADSPPADASAQEDSQNDGLKKPVTKPPAHTSVKASSAKSSAGANKRPSDKERSGAGGPSKTQSAKASENVTNSLYKLQKAKSETPQKSAPVKATADSRKTSTLKSKSEASNTLPQSPRKSSKHPTEREKSSKSEQTSEPTKTSAKKSMGSTPKSSAPIGTGQTQRPKPKDPTKSSAPTKESSKTQSQAQAAKEPTRPQMPKGSSKSQAQKLKEADKSPRNKTTDSTKKEAPTHSQPSETSPQKHNLAFNSPRKPSSKPLQESKRTSKQPSKNIQGTSKPSQDKLSAPPKDPPKSTVRQTVAQKPTKPRPAAAKKQNLRTDVLKASLTTTKAAEKPPRLSENLPPQSSSESSTLPSEMSQSPDSPKPLWETEELGPPSPHLSDPIYNDPNYETDSELARSVSLPPSTSPSDLDSFTSTQAFMDEDDMWSFDESDKEEGGDVAGEEVELGAVGGEEGGERAAGEGEDEAVREEETEL